jgi:hypothetical protein
MTKISFHISWKSSQPFSSYLYGRPCSLLDHCQMAAWLPKKDALDRQADTSKPNLGTRPGFGQDHRIKRDGQNPGSSTPRGPSLGKQACWRRAWVVKPRGWQARSEFGDEVGQAMRSKCGGKLLENCLGESKTKQGSGWWGDRAVLGQTQVLEAPGVFQPWGCKPLQSLRPMWKPWSLHRS